MNAGTYEDNISLLVSSVYYYDIEKNIFVTKNVNIGDFDRRSSIFDNNKCIISCEFKLSSGDYSETLERLLEIKKERYLKQPRNYYNAGSVFKRPIHQNKEYFVWKLVEDCGLRGLSENDAMISDKHTGFIVNKGNATYEDIKYLIDLIIAKVYSRYGIKLELEWKIL